MAFMDRLPTIHVYCAILLALYALDLTLINAMAANLILQPPQPFTIIFLTKAPSVQLSVLMVSTQLMALSDVSSAI